MLRGRHSMSSSVTTVRGECDDTSKVSVSFGEPHDTFWEEDSTYHALDFSVVEPASGTAAQMKAPEFDLWIMGTNSLSATWWSEGEVEDLRGMKTYHLTRKPAGELVERRASSDVDADSKVIGAKSWESVKAFADLRTEP
jgi:hypothetical protein